MRFARAAVPVTLFFLCMAGAMLVLPYAVSTLRLSAGDIPLPMRTLVILQVMQTCVLAGVSVTAGAFAAQRTGLGAPFLSVLFRQEPPAHYPPSSWGRFASTVFIALLAGIVTTAVIVALDVRFFGMRMDQFVAAQHIPQWERILASVYGGVNEEVLMRFFVLSALAAVFARAERRTQPGLSRFGAASAILLTSVIFAMGHLPFVLSMQPSDVMLVVTRTLLLNTIGGVTFGILYWRRGLEASIVSHAVSDLCILVFFPVLLAPVAALLLKTS